MVNYIPEQGGWGTIYRGPNRSAHRFNNTADGCRVLGKRGLVLPARAKTIINTALSKVRTNNDPSVKMAVILPGINCEDDVVETTAEDKIIFANRRGHDGLSRIVLDRKPVLTQSITVVLEKKHRYPPTYLLSSCWTGKDRPLEPVPLWAIFSGPKPHDRSAKSWNDLRRHLCAKCLAFWTTHAFVATVSYDPKTITATVPAIWTPEVWVIKKDEDIPKF